MRVADYIIETIYNRGTDTLFSVSGRGALFLTDAVAKHGIIKNVAVHHEQSAAFAAVSYAQYSGKIGACLVSTGCASTNAITGVLSAWQDNIPCIFISGQNILHETTNYTGMKIRTFGQQEADIIPMIKTITKYAAMLHKPEDIVEELEKALYYATEGRPGPVWLDIPLDLQSAKVNVEAGNESFKEIPVSVLKPLNNTLQEVVTALDSAERPVVLIGSGVRTAKAEALLIEFVEKNNIPLVYSNSAPDVYGSKHRLSIGSIGSMGASRAGNFCIQNSDLVLVLGNRLSSYSTGVDYCDFAREAKVIVVDIDAEEHQKKSITIHNFIHSDVGLFLKEINLTSIRGNNSDWVETCLHWKQLFGGVEDSFTNSTKIDLYELAEVLSHVLPEKCSVVTDSGFIEVILPTNLKFGSGQRAIHPISQGAMGFALPASIGVHFASVDPVFVVVGDGSIMMNLQEFQTLKHNNIPVKVLVINNDVYGIIRRRQSELFRGRTIGTDPANGVSCPNFKDVATAFGFGYMCIDKKDALESSLQLLTEMDGPVLCEIMCREDQSYIEVGTARDVNRKMVRRPLEDQFPFLDREIFLKEMIVSPIKQ